MWQQMPPFLFDPLTKDYLKQLTIVKCDKQEGKWRSGKLWHLGLGHGQYWEYLSFFGGDWF